MSDRDQPKRGTSVKNSADAGCGAKIDKSAPDGLVSHILNTEYLKCNKDITNYTLQIVF